MDNGGDNAYYKRIVGANKENYIRVKIDDDIIEKIKELTYRVVIEKQKEFHHKFDGNKEYKRFYTGFLGEAAIEKFFGINIIDWSYGDSKKYDVADLSKIGLKIGIKTSEVYNFPIIFKHNTYPQIINIRYGSNVIFICGLATVDILNCYQNDELILSPALRRKGTKTGFYGFNELISLKGITDINELDRYCHELVYN